MGVVKRFPRPIHYPGHTVWGKVDGPVVEVGDVIRGNDQLRGVTVYLNERELNESCHGMWGESYEQLRNRLNETGVENALLKEQVDELTEALEHMQSKVTAADLVAKALEEIKAEEAKQKETV